MNYKSTSLILLLTTLMAVTPILAGPAGKSSIIQLDLVTKDPSDWSTVKGGAFGKLTWNTMTGDYVFTGHRLEAGDEYTLINFARDLLEWPATIYVMGAGTANKGGNLKIKANYDYTTLMADTTPTLGGDAKVWLVKTDAIIGNEIDGFKLSGWTPAEILFEAELI